MQGHLPRSRRASPGGDRPGRLVAAAAVVGVACTVACGGAATRAAPATSPAPASRIQGAPAAVRLDGAGAPVAFAEKMIVEEPLAAGGSAFAARPAADGARGVPSAPRPAASSAGRSPAPRRSAPARVCLPLRRGETLYSLAKKQGVAVATLLRDNKIEDPSAIPAGTLICFAPAGGQEAAAPPVPAAAGDPASRPRRLRGDGIAIAPARASAAPPTAAPAGAPGNAPARPGRNAAAAPPLAAERPAREPRTGKEPVQAAMPLPSLPTPAAPPSPSEDDDAPRALTGAPVPPDADDDRDDAAPAVQPALSWPVPGRVTAGFGRRGARDRHDGLDIDGDKGDDVRAAAAGLVVHSGSGGDYGNYVVIDHGGGITTLYAHTSALYVDEGDSVERGDRIAAVGRSGNARGTHLHFEVRRDGVPVDPAPFLERERSGSRHR